MTLVWKELRELWQARASMRSRLLSMLLSLITLNATRCSRPLFVYPGSTLLVIVIGAILMSLLNAAAGVSVSLRAPTVRAAAQVFSVFTLVVFVGARCCYGHCHPQPCCGSNGSSPGRT